MSKSMWIDGIICKPIAETRDNCFPYVLFWVEGRKMPYMGMWDDLTKRWINEEGFKFPERQVKYFAYIDNPYK